MDVRTCDRALHCIYFEAHRNQQRLTIVRANRLE